MPVGKGCGLRIGEALAESTRQQVAKPRRNTEEKSDTFPTPVSVPCESTGHDVDVEAFA